VNGFVGFDADGLFATRTWPGPVPNQNVLTQSQDTRGPAERAGRH
jgi:hypothetical protein